LDKVVELLENGRDSLNCLISFKPLQSTFAHYANKDEDTAEFIATTKEELSGENISYTIVAEALIREYFSDILSKVEKVSVNIKNRKNGICVSTVHRYKGLENTAVIFCPEYETNSHPYSIGNKCYESEENILYTAITRPLDHLCIVVTEKLENLHPSLYKLFPSVANMAECGLVDIADGNLNIPLSPLSWKDKIHGLDFTKYSLDRDTDRDSFVLILRETDGDKNVFRLESAEIRNKIVCFSNRLTKQ
jgi:hypothetical protein